MILFSSFNVKSAGSMGDVNVFAAPGGICLPNVPETRY